LRFLLKDDNIIEDVIRYNLPVLKETIEKIKKANLK